MRCLKSVPSLRVLFVGAHYAEFKALLEHRGILWKKIGDEFWVNDTWGLGLCLGGEGVFKSLSGLTRLLEHTQVQKVVNLGVAGYLRVAKEPSRIGERVWLRYVYLAEGESLGFESFTLNWPSRLKDEELRDGITTSHRTVAGKWPSIWSAYAEVVDREVWGLAYACYQKKIPLYSGKVISDEIIWDRTATDEAICEAVIARQADWAQAIQQLAWDFLMNEENLTVLQHPDSHLATENVLPLVSSMPPSHKAHSSMLPIDEGGYVAEEPWFFHLPEFHWSYAQKKQALSYWTKWKPSQRSLLEEKVQTLIEQKKLRPKDRSRELLHILREEAYPVLASYSKQWRSVQAELAEQGIGLSDNHTEPPSFSLRFSFSSSESLQKKWEVIEKKLVQESDGFALWGKK